MKQPNKGMTEKNDKAKSHTLQRFSDRGDKMRQTQPVCIREWGEWGCGARWVMWQWSDAGYKVGVLLVQLFLATVRRHILAASLCPHQLPTSCFTPSRSPALCVMWQVQLEILLCTRGWTRIPSSRRCDGPQIETSRCFLWASPNKRLKCEIVQKSKVNISIHKVMPFYEPNARGTGLCDCVNEIDWLIVQTF